MIITQEIIRVFKEKWNTAYYAKYLNDPQL